MLYVSWSGKNNANKVCANIAIGKPFEHKTLKGKKPLLHKNENQVFYSYLFPMNFDEAAECKVFVDQDDVVTQLAVEIY